MCHSSQGQRSKQRKRFSYYIQRTNVTPKVSSDDTVSTVQFYYFYNEYTSFYFYVKKL